MKRSCTIIHSTLGAEGEVLLCSHGCSQDKSPLSSLIGAVWPWMLTEQGSSLQPDWCFVAVDAHRTKLLSPAWLVLCSHGCSQDKASLSSLTGSPPSLAGLHSRSAAEQLSFYSSKVSQSLDGVRILLWKALPIILTALCVPVTFSVQLQIPRSHSKEMPHQTQLCK